MKPKLLEIIVNISFNIREGNRKVKKNSFANQLMKSNEKQDPFWTWWAITNIVWINVNFRNSWFHHWFSIDNPKKMSWVTFCSSVVAKFTALSWTTNPILFLIQYLILIFGCTANCCQDLETLAQNSSRYSQLHF